MLLDPVEHVTENLRNGGKHEGGVAMPIYEYVCNNCRKKFSRTMTFSQHERRPRPACPKCNSHRVSQRPSAFQAVTGKKT